jgi:hypothetical protein
MRIPFPLLPLPAAVVRQGCVAGLLWVAWSAATAQDLLPSGYTYVSHSTTQGSYTPATGRWSIGALTTLGPGDVHTLTLLASLNADGEHVNIASASSERFDPDLNNSIDFAEVSVLEPANDTIFANGFEVP